MTHLPVLVSHHVEATRFSYQMVIGITMGFATTSRTPRSIGVQLSLTSVFGTQLDMYLGILTIRL